MGNGLCYYFPGRPESNQMFYTSLNSIFPEMKKNSDIGMVYGFLEENRITFFFNKSKVTASVSNDENIYNFKLLDKFFYFILWAQEVRKKGNFRYNMVITETEVEIMKVNDDVIKLREKYEFSTSFKLSQISAGNSITGEDANKFEMCQKNALEDFQKMSSPNWK